MKKYQDLLIASINRQLEQWFESDAGRIVHEDVDRFLHSIAGTAGTIGLAELSQTARGLKRQLEEGGAREWDRESLKSFLFELIRLSFHSEEALDAKVGDTGLADPAEGATAGKRPALVVLDNDATFLTYIKDELEARGYDVRPADRAELAVRLVHEGDPDCFVLDLHAKDAHGFDVLASLQNKIKHEFLPTTIISSDDSRDNRLRAYRLGADDFVSKPLDIDELDVRLQRQLARKRLFDKLREARRRPAAFRIAIVDDDAVVRTLLTEYVKVCFPPEASVEIRVFRDGEAFMADDWRQGEGPLFVVLDRMMPRMDGLEVLQRLRSAGDSARYTVLMLTGKKAEADIVRALQLGADDYVTKPFSLNELQARISRLAKRIAE